MGVCNFIVCLLNTYCGLWRSRIIIYPYNKVGTLVLWHLSSDKSSKYWWNSSDTWGVSDLAVEWTWGSAIWLFVISLLWNQVVFSGVSHESILSKICFVILFDGYSSYWGLLFSCIIHREDIYFTLKIELSIKITLFYVLEQYLSWISCTCLSDNLTSWNFTQEVNTSKIHLVKILKYMNRDSNLKLLTKT